MLSIKKQIQYILEVLSYKRPIEKASGDVGIKCRKPDTGATVSMIVGSGGINHGIWSGTLGKWLIHGDGSNVNIDGYSLTPTVLSTTYTSNSYVDQTAFKRIQARQYGRLVVVNGNLQVTASMPKSSGFTKIGKINLPKSALAEAGQQVPCGASGDINISILTDGTIQLYNYKTTAASGWARFQCTLILS